MRLYDESATISRAVTNIPTSREALVSGKIAVTTSATSRARRSPPATSSAAS
nr:hypothetical protein [Gordonia spumicola]